LTSLFNAMLGIAALLGLVVWVGVGLNEAEDNERAADEYIDPADLYPTGAEIASGEAR
jgi:hypothetical protein